MKRRLAVGRISPRGTRMVVPHTALKELALGAAQWRQKGLEVELSADPRTINGGPDAPDHGMRVTIRKAVR